MQVMTIFYDAVVEGISTLGPATKRALEEQLDLEGFDMTEEKMDPGLLDTRLKEMFGSGSEAIMKIIYDRFIEMLGDRQSQDFPANMTAAERILKILEKYKGVK